MTAIGSVPGERSHRVVVTCGVFEPGFRGGGPIRSVASIIDSAAPDLDINLITADRDLGSDTPYPGLSGRWVPRGRNRVFYLGVRHPGQWTRLFTDLRREPIDLLYVNSFWAPATTVVPLVAVWLGLLRVGRVLVAPRGALADGALAVKARKKALVMPWWRRLLRRMDVEWHATAEQEAADIQALFPAARIWTVANQTTLPVDPLPVPTTTSSHLRLVYVGRIAVNKNLHVAVRALRELRSPVSFDIFGPVDDHRYWAECLDAVRTLPGSTAVRYRGELAPSDVRGTFAGYDAFVLPTGGENFGHTIAESLSASCPVVCSDRTPWTDVLRHGGGWVLPQVTPQRLGAELQRLADMPAQERARRRRCAGDAYRAWRSTCTNTNILDVACRVSKPVTT